MPAGFARRLAAFLYDYAGIALYLGVLALVSLYLYPDVQKLFSRSLVWSQLSGFLLVTLPIGLYYVISDSRLVGQSFGKKKLGLRVVSSGRPVSVPRSVLRTFLKFLPWELAHGWIYRLAASNGQDMTFSDIFLGACVYGLVLLYAGTALSPTKRTLYDILSRTSVVRMEGSARSSDSRNTF
ncbi:RDD family protein [Paenibacillus aurantius]|uniref:RDD family protein n=1 Tax=Paenibacillus aurantius TaxID=2918900 RepID=A0AA96LDV5_9BACL|nr:RDD family protein [Paenibacillus aurantius]WNQ11389.1 RDD family protein [Paenibacillus aurantius]